MKHILTFYFAFTCMAFAGEIDCTDKPVMQAEEDLFTGTSIGFGKQIFLPPQSIRDNIDSGIGMIRSDYGDCEVEFDPSRPFIAPTNHKFVVEKAETGSMDLTARDGTPYKRGVVRFTIADKTRAATGVQYINCYSTTNAAPNWRDLSKVFTSLKDICPKKEMKAAISDGAIKPLMPAPSNTVPTKSNTNHIRAK